MSNEKNKGNWWDRCEELNEKWNPGHKARRAADKAAKEKAAQQVVAGGTGFNTAGKTTGHNPEVQKLAAETGLTPQDIGLLIQMFPPKG